MRPTSLAEVSARATRDPACFADACHEFLDAFYLSHGDRETQATMLSPAPAPTGDAFRDAWIGALGEHLAQRWDLPVPDWTGDAAHNRLTAPSFVPDSKTLRGHLLVASPPAFRSRLIFTGAEPLQRARFPRDGDEVKVAVPWPRKAARD